MDANITPPDGQHEYTVGEAASLHGLTVRTLHHWEQRGLLNPAHDEFNGYRYYTDTDLERITVIMGYRATGIRTHGVDRAFHAALAVATSDIPIRPHRPVDGDAPEYGGLGAQDSAAIRGFRFQFSLGHVPSPRWRERGRTGCSE